MRSLSGIERSGSSTADSFKPDKPSTLPVAVSAALHLVLLLALLATFAWKKLKVGGIEASSNSRERFNQKYYKFTLICCLGVSLFSLTLCVVTSSYYCYKSKLSYSNLLTLLDFLLRAISWGALCVYLHPQFFSRSDDKSFPFVLRLWWGLYFLISCYVLANDVIFRHAQTSSQIQYLVSDVVYVLVGFFLCYVGLLKNVSEDPLLEEALLHGDSRISVNSDNRRRGDSATPYSNAGLLSLLTFSWMGPLIAVDNEKALNLEDVPQLHASDSVVGAFRVFRNKLDSGAGVTMTKLVKALIFSAWQDILVSGFLSLLYTTASYVGPYLIDVFVQWLNGQGECKNEGYLLAFTFLVAKLVECLSKRHCFFKVRASWHKDP